MIDSACCVCSKSKAHLICGLCRESICKKCAMFVEENKFSFLSVIPKDLTHTTYCGSCFDQKVLLEMTQYDETMLAAKNILVFTKAQFKETRMLKRTEDPIHIIECADYDETILRLAFCCAQLGYNGIIDAEITSKKIKVGNYQTTVFSGTAIPTHVREEKLIKDRSNWSSPN